MTSPFRSTAVVGAGAVGSFFGAMLARAGHPVTLIARPAHVEAIERAGLRLQMAGRVDAIRTAASTDIGAVRGADLVLFCVKSTDTESVAREMAPHLADGALVLSLQNGVENAATIARHVRQAVVPAVVYVATAMPEPGLVSHHGRGDLVIGPIDAKAAQDAALAARLQALVDLFATAQVPVRISADVMAELWSKLMVNCAYNAISGIAQASYGKLTALGRGARAAGSRGARGRRARRGRRREPAARARARGDAQDRAARCRPSCRRPRRTWPAASRARSITSTASSRAAAPRSASPRRRTRRCTRSSG